MERKPYIAGEEFNYVWAERDVFEFDRLWKEGKTVKELANRFDCSIYEIYILSIDRIRKGAVPDRGLLK